MTSKAMLNLDVVGMSTSTFFLNLKLFSDFVKPFYDIKRNGKVINYRN